MALTGHIHRRHPSVGAGPDLTPVFVVDCVQKWYGNRRVLSSASFRCMPGTIRVLMGRNGAGKSSLLRFGVGLMRAESGVVHFAGKSYLKPQLHVLARRGLFFMPDYGLPAWDLTVREQLQLVGRLSRRECFDEIIDTTGIAHLLNALPFSLSGGECRRVACALAFARNPVCLIADEPYMGIAPKDAECLTRIFRALAHQGCAVGLSGHEVDILLDSADHITWCTSGTTHELGTPSEARSHYLFSRDYLGRQAQSHLRLG